MFNHPYLIEKLIELEKPRTTRFRVHQLPRRPRRANRYALSLGRAMRRTGERLEAWAGPGSSQPRSEYFPDARRY
jgi:hypothetical protein